MAKGRVKKIGGKKYRILPAKCRGTEQAPHDPTPLEDLYYRPPSFTVKGAYLFVRVPKDKDGTSQICPVCYKIWFVTEPEEP